MFRLVLSIFFLVGISGHTANSQEIPDRSGVYIRMTDGSLTPLNLSDSAGMVFVVNIGGRQTTLPYYFHRLREDNQIGEWIDQNLTIQLSAQAYRAASLTLIEGGIESISSIVVRARHPQVVSVSELIDFSDLARELSTYRGREGISVGFWTSGEFADVRPSEGYSLVDNQTGLEGHELAEEILDEYTSEFFFPDEFLVSEDRGSRSIDREEDGLLLMGIVVTTPEGNYPALFQVVTVPSAYIDR